MKTIALATALTAVLAAPAAFASDNLALSLGVEPGQFTTAELIQLRRAIEDQDTVYEAFLRNGGSNPTDASVAYNARLNQAVADDDTVYEAFLRNNGSEVISTQSFGHNDVAQAIFARIFEESREDEN